MQCEDKLDGVEQLGVCERQPIIVPVLPPAMRPARIDYGQAPLFPLLYHRIPLLSPAMLTFSQYDLPMDLVGAHCSTELLFDASMQPRAAQQRNHIARPINLDSQQWTSVKAPDLARRWP